MIENTTAKLNSIDTSSIERKLPLFREIIEKYNTFDVTKKNTILKNIISKVEYSREKSSNKGDIHLKIHYK